MARQRYGTLLSGLAAPNYVTLMSGLGDGKAAETAERVLHAAPPVALAAAAVLPQTPWWVRLGFGALAVTEAARRDWISR